MGRYWLGIDIGGTFTDFTLYDTTTRGRHRPEGRVDAARFRRGGRRRPRALAREHGIDLREIDVVVHGTTIAVNTLIQRTGARLGLLVTEGFRDVLEIQRLRLPNPLDMNGGGPCRSSRAIASLKFASASAPTAASTRRSTRPAWPSPRAGWRRRASRAW